jgi:signal transduction histidine kinase
MASSVVIDVVHHDGTLTVAIVDDGVGGADPTRGSGLRGLADRIEALAGRLTIEPASPQGTRLVAEFPLGDQQ